MSRDVASGTASQEINFWLSMERALEGIDAQLRGDEVVLALDVLKHAKRFHATVSFLTDTGLVEAIDVGESNHHSDMSLTRVVHKYNILMKDFPLNELLSATDLDKVQESLYLIFGHINKKLKLS
jgi:dynein heavy chain 1